MLVNKSWKPAQEQDALRPPELTCRCTVEAGPDKAQGVQKAANHCPQAQGGGSQIKSQVRSPVRAHVVLVDPRLPQANPRPPQASPSAPQANPRPVPGRPRLIPGQSQGAPRPLRSSHSPRPAFPGNAACSSWLTSEASTPSTKSMACLGFPRPRANLKKAQEVSTTEEK